MNQVDLYHALYNRDKSFDKKVFAAVKSTGIFCKLSCPCKKPKLENVVFYDSLETCISLGYRECKVCNPLASLIDDIETKKYSLWLESELLPPKSFKDHPISSESTLNSIKEIFQKNVKISLGKYIRIKRINFILREKKLCVKKNQNYLFAHYIHSPIGLMIAIHTEIGLSLLEFVDRKMLETELIDLKKKTNGGISFAINANTQKLEKQIHEYFSGVRKVFDITIDPIGTDFQKKIWLLLLDIPYGKVCSYKDQAIIYGDINFIRAIASANGKNKISIIIPCHRIIGSNGELVGYGGGIERKKFLLALEKNFSIKA